MGNTSFNCSKQGLILGGEGSGKTLLYMNILFRNQDFKKIQEQTLGFNFDILSMENQNIGLFDIGSAMRSFSLDKKLFKNIFFDFMIFVVGPFNQTDHDLKAIYEGKEHFVWAMTHPHFRSTKVLLVLNELRNTNTKSEWNADHKKKFFEKIFDLKSYGKRVELIIMDVSDKDSYLDLWRGFFEFIIKK